MGSLALKLFVACNATLQVTLTAHLSDDRRSFHPLVMALPISIEGGSPQITVDVSVGQSVLCLSIYLLVLTMAKKKFAEIFKQAEMEININRFG